ncbi:Peroxisomal multifunctional enzyme type 2 [Chelonia mydas]|uniref:Peroxisomal multifunctional enzyme type 2 n=1 Tax=Chelonia mydas TaxID=8469 RepID=M7C3P2_CHEMY|nr:Peroxisomal multifunctional enzyme type 2 [Chelonia mydas]
MIIFSSLSDVYKIYKEKVMYDYVVEKKHDIMSSLKCHSGCSILSDDKPSEWQIFDCVPASASGLQSDLVFEEIGRRIKEVGNQLVKKVNAIFQWDITKDGETAAQWSKS